MLNISDSKGLALDTKTVVLVPRREDHGRRDRLWGFCKDWWQHNASDLSIIEAHHNVGLFSRCEALNDAARKAGDWKLALIIDSDIVLRSIQQAREALEIARDTGKMVYGHCWRYALNESTTDALIEGRIAVPQSPNESQLEPPWGSYGPTYSNCQAIHRDLWEEIGGMDERIFGWGVDDWILRVTCGTLRETNARVRGEVFHLYHPRLHANEEGNPMHDTNVQLGKRYLHMENNVEGMREMIREWKVIRDSGFKAQRSL